MVLAECLDLMSEWNWEKNNEMLLDPNSITLGSNKKAYWICHKCKYEWSATVYRRATRGQGCPKCGAIKQKIKRQETIQREILGKGSLGKLYPKLISEWAADNEKTPYEYLPNSHKKVKWKCLECNKIYETRIADKVNKGVRCPFCSGSIPIQGVNDLVTWCKMNNHEYLLQEWDEINNIARPEEYLYGSNKKVYWKCSICGNVFQAFIYKRTIYNAGCTKCRISGTSFPEEFIYLILKFVNSNFRNRDKSNGFELDIYNDILKIGIEYNGKYYHESKEKKVKDFKKQEKCKSLGIELLSIYEEETEILNEETIIWNYSRKYENLMKLAKQVLDWVNLQCNTNYNISENDSKIIFDLSRQYTYGISPEKSLAYLYPKIAKEWDFDKNNGVTPKQVAPHTKDSYYWKCIKCQNSWNASVASRVGGHGCPQCGRKRQIESWVKGRTEKYNFKDWCIDNQKDFLLQDWDEEKNLLSPEEYSYGSNAAIYWKSHLTGHCWKATISNRKQSQDVCQCSECTAIRRKNGLRKNALKDDKDFESWCRSNDRTELLDEWDYKENELGPHEYSKGSHAVVKWVCSACGEKFTAEIRSRANSKKKIGACRHRKK